MGVLLGFYVSIVVILVNCEVDLVKDICRHTDKREGVWQCQLLELRAVGDIQGFKSGKVVKTCFC